MTKKEMYFWALIVGAAWYTWTDISNIYSQQTAPLPAGVTVRPAIDYTAAARVGLVGIGLWGLWGSL